jgi:hypothetical protein
MGRYSEIEFGYDDGRADTVMLRSGGASVTLEGQDLENVTAAVLSLQGYEVKPGIRTLGLRKYKNCRTTTIHDQRMSAGKRQCGPLHFSVSSSEGYTRKTSGGKKVKVPGIPLRLWAQSTTNPSFHMSLVFSEKDLAEFTERLARADRWDLSDLTIMHEAIEIPLCVTSLCAA